MIELARTDWESLEELERWMTCPMCTSRSVTITMNNEMDADALIQCQHCGESAYFDDREVRYD